MVSRDKSLAGEDFDQALPVVGDLERSTCTMLCGIKTSSPSIIKPIDIYASMPPQQFECDGDCLRERNCAGAEACITPDVRRLLGGGCDYGRGGHPTMRGFVPGVRHEGEAFVSCTCGDVDVRVYVY